MYSPTARDKKLLLTIGQCLKQVRIANNQYQAEFAERLGISVPTYRKMEQGHAAVPIGYWIRALDLLDQSEEITRLLNQCHNQPAGHGGNGSRQRARKAKQPQED